VAIPPDPVPAPADTVTRPIARGRAAITAVTVVAIGLAVIAVGVAGLALSHRGTAPRPAATRAAAPAVPAANAPRPAAGARTAPPVGLTIPAIGVRTRLIRLGLTPAGALQVPATFSVAGWYDRSPRPGATGSAIIAGHIDSLAGPAVFYRLASLRRGDRAYVRRADGSIGVFRVTAVHMYPKDRFPTAAVYGPVPDPQLRLITCGGTFDPSLGSYLSNVVVYAVAAGGHPGLPAATGRRGFFRRSSRAGSGSSLPPAAPHPVRSWGTTSPARARSASSR
jgi:hypothetical protein